ncbi:hypothetical protein BSKO_06256 [Bryopsis sp. KO-2023]|nr:hypothetical protein BSKO_06256 [Bryopsis sp. KO-2023]
MEDNTDARFNFKSTVSVLLEYTFEDKFRYADKINDLFDAETGKMHRRFLFDIERIQAFDQILWERVLNDPATALPAFEETISEHGRNPERYPDVAKALEKDDQIMVGFTGEFGSHLLSPRELSASRMNQLVCLVGIVTRASTVRPKVVQSVHYCEECKSYTVQDYRDVTSNVGLPTGASYPSKDREGHILETEYGLCKYVNSQVISIQELPEVAPPGLLPRSFDVILEHDLVDKCKPGDRIYAAGIFKALVPRAQNQMSGAFRGVLVANNIKLINKSLKDDITLEEVKKIKQLSRSPDVLERLAQSLAPTIFGHDIIKKGLVLQLLGGCEKNLDSGTHLRGDINCLLVGDPGTAKSQLLRAVMSVCPLAVSTTGRGSTGVGLTAAVVTDPDTGDRRLEAGAMVLADGGVVCIDEFDKMNDLDRVAIHEVMEQQTVTIAKAGIHVALNARCSVVAAANPLYGNYDDSITISRNVNLPDSLLSRFDMLFIVLDEQSKEQDREIGSFVLDWHRQQTSGVEARPMMENVHSWYMEQALEESSKSMYVAQQRENQGDEDADILTPQFLRKYVMYAKRRMSRNIDLSDEACKAMGDYYVEVRSTSQNRSLPVTPRALESLVRLATAHAKLRLSGVVQAVDVSQAIDIMNVVLRNEPDLQQKKKRHSGVYTAAHLANAEDDDIMDTDENRTAATQQQSAPSSQPIPPTQSQPPQQEAMEVDAGPDGLTDEQKKAVISGIGECIAVATIVKLSDLKEKLSARGVTLDSNLVEEYLAWIMEHYEEQPGVLPQIMYDSREKVFYDVLQ